MDVFSVAAKENKTGTSKVGAISKAQKAQNIFFGKKISFGKCRTVLKNVKEGTLFDFQTCILLQNNKNLKGGPFGDIKKISKESHTVPKKNKRGDPLASAGFVGYVKKVKHEKGDPLETKKISRKKSHSAEKKTKKNRKGGSLVPSGFVGYLEKVKNERGDPLH